MINILSSPEIEHNLPTEAHHFFDDESSQYILSGKDELVGDLNTSEMMAKVIEGIPGLQGCIYSHEGNYARIVLHDQVRDLIVNRNRDQFEFDCYIPFE